MALKTDFLKQGGRIRKDINWILENESDRWSQNFGDLTNFVTTGAPGATTYGTSFFSKTLLVPMGMNVRLKSFIVSADGPCVFTYNLSKGGLITALSSNIIGVGPTRKIENRGYLVFGVSGGRETVQIADTDIYENGGLSFNFFATGTTQPIVSIDVSSSKMYTSDPDFGASKLWLGIGDSITWTAFGNLNNTFVVNYGDTHYTSRIKKIIQAQRPDFDLRISRRGFGGSSSEEWYNYMQSGALDRSIKEYYNKDKSSLLATIGFGTNEAPLRTATTAITSTTSSLYLTTYRTRTEKILSRIFTLCPNASAIVLGPPDTDLVDRKDNIALYRATASQLVSEGVSAGGLFVGKDLAYYDQSTGLDVNDSNYTEQGAGNHLHPRGDSGHAIIATGNVSGAGTTGLLQVVKARKFYTDNLPLQTS